MSVAPVLIAGAGPVGVITALALAQRDIPVRVFEAAERVNDTPRASTLHPATLEMLAGVGLLDEIVARGLVARTFQFWDRPARRLIAEFDHAILKDDTRYPFVVQCEQHKVANTAIARLRQFAHADVRFSSPVTAVAPGNDRVDITVEVDGRPETISGSYLVGADGGRSLVRKSLDIAFEGYTFPERFLVLTSLFDFATEHGVAYRAYFSDPDEWANLFKVAGDDGLGRWRSVFPTLPGQTDDESLRRFILDYCFDFVTMPCVDERLTFALGHAHGLSSLRSRAATPQQLTLGQHEMIGQCDAMLQLYRGIDKCAHNDAPVFIAGASGTGKD